MSVPREDSIQHDNESLGLITRDKVDVGTLFQKLARSKAPSNINCDFKSNMQMILLHSLPKSPSSSFVGNTSMKDSFYPLLPSQGVTTLNSPSNKSMRGFIPHSFLGSEGVKTRRKLESTSSMMLNQTQNRRFVNKSSIADNTIHTNMSGFSISHNYPGQTQHEQKFFDVKGLLKTRSKGSRQFQENSHTRSVKDLHQNLNTSQQTIVYNYKPVKITHHRPGDERNMGVGRSPRKINKNLRLPKLV